MKYRISVLVMTILLAACSASNEDEKEQRKEIVDAVHQPLEKAKAVEQIILDGDAEQRKQMDDM